MAPQPSRRAALPAIPRRLQQRATFELLDFVERIALPLDRSLARRSRISHDIPRLRDRKGGKLSYSDWCWLIGILQAEMHRLVDPDQAPTIVDLGCGAGLGAIAATSIVGTDGDYIGLDVRTEDVDFCSKHYAFPTHRFAVLDQKNDFYRADGDSRVTWPIDDNSADMVTAVSVWSHLLEEDARFAFQEASRVLKPGGHILMTTFVTHADTPRPPSPTTSRFHNTSPQRWRFERSLGNGWYTTDWANPPEAAVAMSEASLRSALSDAGLALERIIQGTWSERPGLFFQDIVIARAIDQA